MPASRFMLHILVVCLTCGLWGFVMLLDVAAFLLVGACPMCGAVGTVVPEAPAR